MKIGICEWNIPATGFESRFQWAAEAGLQAVEIDLQNAAGHEAQVRACFNHWKLAVPTLGMNACCTYSMCNPADRKTIEAAFEAGIRTALELGIAKLQVPSFAASFIESTDDFNQTVACFQFACRLAENTDLIIGTENALSAEQQLELLNRVGSDRLKIYFDTRNAFAMNNLNSAGILETLYPHLCEVHIKDGINNGPACPLGEGNSGFFQCLEILKAQNYSGWLLLENDYKTLEQARVDIETTTNIME
ncbi:sugar phosphate isomerase/epimerase [Pontiellaceae bacterium B12227]|nr:sugar phosphate isomerase/epimerase [Pontiellaceae bacterium B12227]